MAGVGFEVEERHWRDVFGWEWEEVGYTTAVVVVEVEELGYAIAVVVVVEELGYTIAAVVVLAVACSRPELEVVRYCRTKMMADR